MFLFLFVLANALCTVTAQIIDQPDEIITAAPLRPFSERVGPSGHRSLTNLNTENTSYTEALNSVPGLAVRESGSPTYSIRGSAQTDRVLNLIDGISLNTIDGFGASSLLLPKEAIGSVDVLKGPASVYYGPSAMAGALHHRLRWFERPGLRAGMADNGGIYNKQSGFLVLPWQWGAQKRVQGSAFWEQDGGDYLYQSSSTGKSGRRENNNSRMARGVLAAEQKWSKLETEQRFIYADQAGASPGALNFPTPQDFHNSAYLASAGFRHALTDDYNLSWRLSTLASRLLYKPPVASKSLVKKSFLNIDFAASVLPHLQLRTLADIYHHEFQATYYNNNERFSENSYELAQLLTWTIHDKWILQPGLRFTHPDKKFFKTASLFWLPTANSKSWLTYNEGYRRASLTDRHAVLQTFRGNPDLKPESSWGTELGYSNDALNSGAHKISLGSATFWTQYQDFVETESLGGGLTTKRNRGRSRSSGVEIWAQWQAKPWSALLQYGYTKAEDLDRKEPMRLAPEHQASFTGTYSWNSLVFEVKDTLWSPYYDRSAFTSDWIKLPMWNTVDISVYTQNLDDWEIRGGVQNIFDRPRELTLAYPEPQRRVYASVLRFF